MRPTYRHRIYIGVLCATCIAVSAIGPTVRAADTKAVDQIINGFANTGTAAGYPIKNKAPAIPFEQALIIYVNGFLTLMGAMFMLMIIYAGWLWMTARGNSEQVSRSKLMMINAFIGFAFILGARIIVEFALAVLGKSTIFNVS